ncbi:MAG: shikimate dehydrogenase [Clostridia bacterium]|nr:shikimate dehydrogenase [Clostridia bacterium]
MEYGLIGEKLGHSFSTQVHAKIGNYDYTLKEINKDDLEKFIKSRNFKGINVTIPYKQQVMPYLDYIDANAKEIGAVNTIVNKNNKLFGYNTDYNGIIDLINKSGVNIKDKNVLILGTGGSSNTIFTVLKNLNAKEIIKVSRTPDRNQVNYDNAHILYPNTQIIFNATPVGMFPENNNTPINLHNFKNLECVFDLIYNPLKTRLIKEAEALGLKAFGGLYMLVAQAVRAGELFLDTTYKPELTNSIYNDIFNNKMNIVLTGMPGSGKSTIGKQIAKITGRKFYDTDTLIEKKLNKSITEIFKTFGEEKFRNIESNVIYETSKLSGVIISTGGGAVLNNENIINLKQNGKVFFLNRSLDELIPTADRPLANTKQGIIKCYNERINIYNNTCDVIVPVTDIEETAQKIINYFC